MNKRKLSEFERLEAGAWWHSMSPEEQNETLLKVLSEREQAMFIGRAYILEMEQRKSVKNEVEE